MLQERDAYDRCKQCFEFWNEQLLTSFFGSKCMAFVAKNSPNLIHFFPVAGRYSSSTYCLNCGETRKATGCLWQRMTTNTPEAPRLFWGKMQKIEMEEVSSSGNCLCLLRWTRSLIFQKSHYGSIGFLSGRGKAAIRVDSSIFFFVAISWFYWNFTNQRSQILLMASSLAFYFKPFPAFWVFMVLAPHSSLFLRLQFASQMELYVTVLPSASSRRRVHI